MSRFVPLYNTSIDDTPLNVPVYGKFPEWKNWKRGYVTKDIHGSYFHYTDSKGHNTFRQIGSCLFEWTFE